MFDVSSNKSYIDYDTKKNASLQSVWTTYSC